jgi:hypothetical protein
MNVRVESLTGPETLLQVLLLSRRFGYIEIDVYGYESTRILTWTPLTCP